jgi:hypothetical protein
VLSFEGEVPTEYASGDGYIVATWRNALLMMWTGTITSIGLDATERGGKMLERRYKENQIAISISLPKVPIPDEKVRAHAARLLRERAAFVKLSVTILEGDGFWLSAGRMVMTALNQLSGGKHKPIIAKSIDEAVPHIQPLVTPKASLAEVTRALRAFRG